MKYETRHSSSMNSNSGYKENQKSQNVKFRFVLTTLRKFKWSILGLTLLLTAIAAAIVWSMNPTFRASASMLFEVDETGVVIKIDELISQDAQGAEYLLTQAELLRSNAVAKLVVDELDLINHWDLNESIPMPSRYRNKGPISDLIEKILVVTKTQRTQLKDTLASFRGGAAKVNNDLDSETTTREDIIKQRIVQRVVDRTRVGLVKGTNLIKISFESTDPVLAASVANEIGKSYLSLVVERVTDLTSEAYEKLVVKERNSRIALENSEATLLQFRQENNLVEFRGDVSGLTEQELWLITQSGVAANQAYNEAEILYNDVLWAQQNSQVELGSVPAISSNSSVQRYLFLVQENEKILSELGNRYLEQHPKMVDARSNLNRAKENYEVQVQNAAGLIVKNFNAAQDKVRELRRMQSFSQDQIQDIQEKQPQLVQLEREVNSNQELHDRFFDRVREADESKGLARSLAFISDKATVPLLPIKPRKSLILGTVFLLSLIGFGASVFAFEDYKDTIQGTHDVEEKLSLSVLGVIPTVVFSAENKKLEASVTPATLEDPEGLFEESIRTLRTGIRLANTESRILLITSSVPSEGKSTVAINLANIFARHERTLLIEADMRRPGIAKALSLKGMGLADVLSGSASFSKCVHKDVFSGLDVLSAGNIDSDSAELLGGRSLKTMITILSNHYDRIIIDSAPVQAVSDALTLGEVVDSTLFVVKANSTTSVEASAAVQRLRNFGQNISGVVITQVNLKNVKKYGGDHYYQGYMNTYGYGYTNSAGNKNFRYSKKVAS